MPHLPMPAATAATAGLLLAAAVPSLAVTLAAVAEQAPSFSEGGSAIGHAYEGMRGSASLALADASVRGRVLLDSQDRGSGGSGPAVAVLIVLFVVLPILGGVLGCCGCYYCYRNDMCCFEGQGRRKKAEQPAAVAVYYEDAAQQPLGMGMGTPAPIQVPPPASFSQQHVAAQQAPQEWYPAGVLLADAHLLMLKCKSKWRAPCSGLRVSPCRPKETCVIGRSQGCDSASDARSGVCCKASQPHAHL
jgi:hypothetical protein